VDAKRESMLEDVCFDGRGLVPVVAVASGGRPLMLAYADRQALERTLETGKAHFFSRSRRRPWRKGETSGNELDVDEVWLDCDGDAVAYVCRPRGPACHTGRATCFHRRLDGDAIDHTMPYTLREGIVATGHIAPAGHPARAGLSHELYSVIREQLEKRPEGSYLASLAAGGLDAILKKVGEKATEVVMAAKDGDRDHLAAEVADLWFHTLVLCARLDLSPAAVLDVLQDRRGTVPLLGVRANA